MELSETLPYLYITQITWTNELWEPHMGKYLGPRHYIKFIRICEVKNIFFFLEKIPDSPKAFIYVFQIPPG